jgi:isopenicillin N synthase-like dioxygenase
VSFVPVVDISADPGAVGAELDEICRAAGFFQVTGHGVPGGVAERAWKTATRFFDLPPEDKLSVARPRPDYPYGYIPLAGESLSRSMGGAAPPDMKEVFNAGPPTRPTRPFADPDEAWAWSPSLWPAALPELREAWTAYYDAMRDLGDRLMSLFARGLDLPPGFFADKTGQAANALRAINYPARDTAPLPGQMRAGAHTDYGTLTILRQDAVGGLEVLDPGARRVRDQHRGPDGALDQRPVAFDPAPGGRSARSRRGRGAQAEHAVFPERQLVRGDLLPADLPRARREAALRAGAGRAAPGGQVPQVRDLLIAARGARRLAHRRAAAILDRAGAADRVAAHLLATGPAGDAWVVQRLSAAADTAWERGAAEVAASYLRRALAEPATQAERPALLRRLGVAEWAAGDPDAIGHLKEALNEARDATAIAAAAGPLANAYIISDQADVAVVELQRVVARIRATDPRLALRLDGAAVLAGLMDDRTAPAALQTVDRLRASLAEYADPPGRVLVAIAHAEMRQGWPPDETRRLVERVLAREPYPPRPNASASIIVTLLGLEAFGMLQRLCDDMLRDARRRSAVQELIGVASFSAWALSRRSPNVVRSTTRPPNCGACRHH